MPSQRSDGAPNHQNGNAGADNRSQRSQDTDFSEKPEHTLFLKERDKPMKRGRRVLTRAEQNEELQL